MRNPLEDNVTTTKFLTVEEQYQEWWARVKPKGEVSDVQVQECRRAFYGGWSQNWINLTLIIGMDEISEEEGGRRMSKWNKELAQYWDRVKRGEE